MIVYDLGQDGSFVAGDTITRRTTYAYPTSLIAAQARKARSTHRHAVRQMKLENALAPWRDSDFATTFDAGNWARLKSRGIATTEKDETK